MTDRRTLMSRTLSLLIVLAGCNSNIDGHAGADPGSDPAGSTGSEGSAGGSSGSGSGTGGSNAGGSGTGGSSAGGAGGAGGTGGAVSSGGTGGASSCVGGSLPADVQAVLKTRCQLCHGNPPIPGVPASLVMPDDFSRPSKTQPSKTVAQVAMERVTSTVSTLRMPPVPASPLTSAEIQTLQSWMNAGMPLVGCTMTGGTGGDTGSADGGAPPPVDAGPDPFAAPPKCTSGVTTHLREGGLMDPGVACIACHSKGEGPRFSFGGTVYPSAHEPDDCNGANGTTTASGASVVVVDANGMMATANVNSAGNFYAGRTTALTPPLRAKVVYMGRERLMIGAVPSGDCNSCHTQAGTTTVTTMGAAVAPGRILLP